MDGPDTDDVLTEARAALCSVERARATVASLAGRGRSPDGLVRARVGGDGLLATVRLKPEAMRLDSGALAGQVCAAVRAAQQSFARQAGDVEAGVLGEVADPAGLADQLAAVHAQFAERMAEFSRALDAIHRRLES
ncbi:MAG TPA: YbaB/EbfC family nucleoid-associated protein [Mycobacteriales bacterium]|nr:YbaB/EbfC family nucleoid-associated protein [Mycobacteriales bacterium]